MAPPLFPIFVIISEIYDATFFSMRANQVFILPKILFHISQTFIQHLLTFLDSCLCFLLNMLKNTCEFQERSNRQLKATFIFSTSFFGYFYSFIFHPKELWQPCTHCHEPCSRSVAKRMNRKYGRKKIFSAWLDFQ